MTDATKIMTARRIADEILDDGRINLHVSLKAATMLAEGFRLRDQQQARNHQVVVPSAPSIRYAIRTLEQVRDALPSGIAEAKEIDGHLAILDKLLGGKVAP